MSHKECPMTYHTIKRNLESRMLGNLHVRFGVGGGVKLPALHHYADKEFVAEINLKKIQPAPTHYISKGGKEQILDLVFQCPLKDKSGSLMAVVIFEHQSGSLKKMPHKLLKYISAVWDAEIKAGKPLSAPYFIVLRTGKKPHRGGLPKVADLLPKGRDGKPLGKMVEVEYDVVDLPAWDFDELVGGPELRLTLGMLHKMAGGNIDDLPAALRPLLEIADTEERIVLAKEAAIPFAMKAFAAHDRRLDEAKLDEILKPIFKEKERTMIKTILEEREAIGEARGRAEEKTETGRNMVLAVLRARFKKVPKSVEQAIRQMNDPIALESRAADAATCQSLDEFVQFFG